jgi:hypothetical protein
MTSRQPAATGIPVDASGGPTFDPTANVIRDAAASSTRQDDLREAYNRLVQAQIRGIEESAHTKFEWARELATLHAHYAEKLAGKESERIDAIRKVDVEAVQTAAERANAQAAVLATQVAGTAETLRNLVSTTAAATATAQQQLISPLDNRVRTLEQAQYVGQGRSAVSDPAYNELLSEVKSLRSARSETTGSGLTMDKIIYLLIAVAGLIIAGITLMGKSPSPIPGQMGSQTTAIPNR